MNKWVLFLLCLICIPSVFSYQLVINSKDWRDIYSSSLYSKLNGSHSKYLIHESQAPILNKFLISGEPINLIESAQNPFVFNFNSILKSKGFSVAVTKSYDPNDFTLSLAEELLNQDITKFIVVSGREPYEAISVAPYAVATRSFVLFATKDNIEDIHSFLKENAEHILVFGFVDREVKESLNEIGAEFLKGNDKYSNNLAIVTRFLEKYPDTKQITFTNGEFIEPQFFEPSNPVVFIGNERIPDIVYSFFDDLFSKETEVNSGLLVGQNLFDLARTLKQKYNMRAFLKFAQGLDGELYSIDRFDISVETPKINITLAEYNPLTKKLVITYENIGNVDGYVLPLNIEANLDDVPIKRFTGSLFFLGAHAKKTIFYDVELPNELLVIKVRLASGLSELGLEKVESFDLSVIIRSFEDNSKIEIISARYNIRKKAFLIELKNIGVKAVYAQVEANNMLINDIKKSLSSTVRKIPTGKTVAVSIPAELDDVDIQLNELIDLTIYYGERESAFMKTLIQVFPFTFTSGLPVEIILIGIGLIAIILVVYLWKRIYTNSNY